jgi:hypothetical protein
MPNGHSASGNAHVAANPRRNPLQQNQSTPPDDREPQPFQASTHAAPLRSAQSGNIRPVSNAQKQTPSAAIGPTSSGSPQRIAGPRQNHTNPPQAAGRPRMARRSAAGGEKSYPSKLWQSINVAFDGPDEWTNEPENLPLPEQQRRQNQTRELPRRMIPGPGPGYIEQGEGVYVPYGEPGGYSECGCADCGMGCGGGIGGCGPDCGCAGEVGCACASECGCPCGCGAESPCVLACGDDVCLAGKGDAEACHTIRIGVPKWQELMVFGGVHGFKGPYDQTRDSGNFGFHEGFNAGFKVPFSTAGYQIGYQAVHSQLHGDKNTDISDPHTQQFITAGMFHRVQNGLQFGAVWDMLRDERFGAVDFHQLRSEISLIDRGCHEFGVTAAVHLNEHEPFPADEGLPSVMYQASDQYLLFYRYHGARGGEGRVFGGFNDGDDGILGADLLLPLQDRWSLATGFTYLIPDERAGEDGGAQEAWNIGITLVWHWDCRARSCHSNCYRPLFNVADNGILIVDERLGSPATGE